VTERALSRWWCVERQRQGEGVDVGGVQREADEQDAVFFEYLGDVWYWSAGLAERLPHLPGSFLEFLAGNYWPATGICGTRAGGSPGGSVVPAQAGLCGVLKALLVPLRSDGNMESHHRPSGPLAVSELLAGPASGDGRDGWAVKLTV
jgi:hypothetical protein